MPGPITRTDHVPPSPPTGTTLSHGVVRAGTDARVVAVVSTPLRRVWRIVVARAVFDAVALYGCEYVTAHGCSPPPVPLCVRLDGGGAASRRAVVVAVDSPGLSVTSTTPPAWFAAVHAACRQTWRCTWRTPPRVPSSMRLQPGTRRVISPAAPDHRHWWSPGRAVHGRRSSVRIAGAGSDRGVHLLSWCPPTSCGRWSDNPPSGYACLDEGDWEVHVTVEGREARISRGTADPALCSTSPLWYRPPASRQSGTSVCRGRTVSMLALLGADAATARWSRALLRLGRVRRSHRARARSAAQAPPRFASIERRVASHPVERAGGEVRAHTKRQMAAPSDSKERKTACASLVGPCGGHRP